MTKDDILEKAILMDLEGESIIFDADTSKYYRLMITRSFEARLRQSDKKTKRFYNCIKNEILSFHQNGIQVSPRFSYKHETFKDNRNHGFVLSIRGKTLCVNFAKPLEYFDNRKIKVVDVSNMVMFEDTPSMIRVKTEANLKSVLEIIDEMLYEMDYEKGFGFEMDYAFEFPYLNNQALVEKNLIKCDIEETEKPSGKFITFEPAKEKKKIKHKSFKRNEEEKVSDNRFSIEYHRSFLAKLIQADMDTKYFYDILKNELMSYKKIKSHYYWGDETFRANSLVQAKLAFSGKTLCLYLNLETTQFNESKFQVENKSDKKKFSAVPCLYRIRNNKKCRYAKELIALAMKSAKLKKDAKYKPNNYKTSLLYKSDAVLLKEGLIRKLSSN